MARPRRRGPYKAQQKQGYYTRLAPDLRERMRACKAATGVPEAQQIDQALRVYLDAMDAARQQQKQKQKKGR